ncbi:unnamed protein product [Schistosoma curassoni]|uniref:Similar to n=1 Tax=Schistosoma curassoni TaxID=6186 RepID=A0A183L004_9TREM|nr:unnamed protein product [Schistosoma curassoni]
MQNTTDSLVRNHQQQPTVGQNKPDPSGGRSQEEALGVDRTHIEKSTQGKPSSLGILKAEEHITSRNGDRHEKDEPELDGTRKKGLG